MLDALPHKPIQMSRFHFEERKSVTIRCRSSVPVLGSAEIAAPRQWIGLVVETRCVNFSVIWAHLWT